MYRLNCFLCFSIILFVITFNFHVAIAGQTYYVATTGNDSNDGSLISPWRTIWHAINNTGPGDTVMLREGTYEENGIWMQRSLGHGGSATGGMWTLRNYPGESAVLSNIPFSLTADYLRFEGLRFENLSYLWWSSLGSISHIEVVNNYFTTGGQTVNWGLVHMGGDHILVEGNIFEDLGFSPNKLHHAIYLSEGVGHYIIRNNYVDGRNIQVFGHGAPLNDILIEGNIMKNAAWGAGIHVQSYPVEDVTVRNNTVYHTNLNGILIKDGQNVLVTNNTIYENGRIGIRVIGSNVSIHNNIIHQTPGNGICQRNCNYDIEGHLAVPADALVSHNLYWPLPIVSEGANDSIPILADPLFVNAGAEDFHLQAQSPAIDAGIYVGLPYNGSAPDLGAFEFGVLTSTTDHSPKQPEVFMLHQNYPNPFNPETKIIYEIFEFARISIKLYDMTGKELKTLVDDVKVPGYYSVTWDGRNAAREQVASGIYLYRINVFSEQSSRKFSQTKRMILLH
jgi:parallel beta-helix repeat protein